MEIKIEKKLSKTGKEYVGLWFENWLVTIDRRAIYKLVPKDRINHMKVGDIILIDAIVIPDSSEIEAYNPY